MCRRQQKKKKKLNLKQLLRMNGEIVESAWAGIGLFPRHIDQMWNVTPLTPHIISVF